MNPHRHPRVPPLLFLAALTLLAGCSLLPTRPTTVQHSATATRVIPAPGDEPTLVLPALDEITSTTRDILGLLGGTVRAGRFSVDIPPAAFLGLATVTVSQMDPATRECDLRITPPSANGFAVPVLLTADMKGSLPPELMKYTAIQWYNPATDTWQHVPGSAADSVSCIVTAPLRHFSQYRVAVEGRASW